MMQPSVRFANYVAFPAGNQLADLFNSAWVNWLVDSSILFDYFRQA
jgi:hypothetical protein